VKKIIIKFINIIYKIFNVKIVKMY